MEILYIDCTVREGSRTSLLAERLLGRLGGNITRIRPNSAELPPVDEAFIESRNAACAKLDFSDGVFDLAKQFAAADVIVISAPYYDLSFPAVLKQYLEQVCVVGLTFAYGEDGRPYGMCRAGELYYVTTAGGSIISEEYGFGYIKALAEGFFGIGNTMLFKAEGLDIFGADVQSIMEKAFKEIDAAFGQ